MGFPSLLLLWCVSWTSFILGTHQLQSSQTQVLLQLRKHLEYPKQLELWKSHNEDFCYIPSSNQVNITCQNDVVTELRILGDRAAKVGNFDGSPIANQTLSEKFSIDSFVVTLARLSSLRVLSLVSLGIWGPLPGKIHRLANLEILDLGSNFLSGSIPPKITTMVKLQNLTLDGNFFNGTLPDGLDSLLNLTFISLSNNQLSGPLPTSIGKLTALTNLDLSNNEISGEVPDLGGLESLYLLDLSGNKISSKLPSMPRGLVMVFLSHNSFSDVIPKQYGQLGQLQKLDLSFNSIEGTPPGAVFSLQNISYVSLASNMLSGSLPQHLRCGSNLGFVDLSYNRLTGILPPCLSTTLSKRVTKVNGNCLGTHLQHQHPESYCMEGLIKKNHHKSRNLGILIGVIGGIFVVGLLLGYGILIACRKVFPRCKSAQHLLKTAENSATGFSVELLTNARYISEAAKLGAEGLPACRLFSLDELKEATLNFDKASCISEGSNGKLYKGRLENGAQVVIRCLSLSKKFTIRNLKLRLDLLARLRHPHLVCLLGHCIDISARDKAGGDIVLLVYEFVGNGNFSTHLSESNPAKILRWSERLAILISVAKAVHFLHTGIIPGFFNNRLKTHNILLNEHRGAKLSDYGLSIILGDTEKLEVNADGLKSWPAENLEDDVYNFGLILLESLVGPSVSARREAFLLHEMSSLDSPDGRRRLVDSVVLETSSEESLCTVISITSKCLFAAESSRPSFEDILWNLQYAAQIQAAANAD